MSEKAIYAFMLILILSVANAAVLGEKFDLDMAEHTSETITNYRDLQVTLVGVGKPTDPGMPGTATIQLYAADFGLGEITLPVGSSKVFHGADVRLLEMAIDELSGVGYATLVVTGIETLPDTTPPEFREFRVHPEEDGEGWIIAKTPTVLFTVSDDGGVESCYTLETDAVQWDCALADSGAETTGAKCAMYEWSYGAPGSYMLSVFCRDGNGNIGHYVLDRIKLCSEEHRDGKMCGEQPKEPEQLCGNGICERGESCYNCPDDCGECAREPECRTDDDCATLEYCPDGSSYRRAMCVNGVCEGLMFAGGSPCFDETRGCTPGMDCEEDEVKQIPVEPPKIPEPPPEETVTLRMLSGWNLFSIPGQLGRLVKEDDPCSSAEQEGLRAFYYDPGTSQFSEASDMSDLTRAYWVYLAWGKCVVTAELVSGTPIRDLSELKAGWNFVPVVPEMVGHNLNELGDCNFKGIYYYDGEAGNWVSLMDTETDSSLYGKALAVYASSDCSLYEELQPPALPDIGNLLYGWWSRWT
jgi:hypothetical protein